MFNYARSDTHFLLYCFDHMRNELLDKSNLEDSENKMSFVLANCREVSLRLYEKEPYDAVGGDGALGWRNLLGRSQEGLNPMQVSVFKAVHQWRDTTARIEDESVNYVMPRHQLFNLARKAPIDVAGVLACCPRPSPPVKTRAGELVVAIRNAKDTPEVREWKKSMALEAEAAAKAAQAAAPAGDEILLVQEQRRVDIFSVPLAQTNLLRAEKSGFWGSCDESSRWHAVVCKNGEGELRLAVPLPQLTAAVFVSADDAREEKSQKDVDPGARAEHEYVKNRPAKKDDLHDVIVVRSLGGGRKRKSTAMNDDEATGSARAVESENLRAEEDPMSESISVEQGLVVADESSRKEKDKGRKKKKKKGGDKAEGEEEAGDKDGEEAEEKPVVQPFDYAAAPSVLNQKREKEHKGSRGKDKKKKAGAFNPYAGSGNAPKGLGRKNQETTGRSSTFKQ